MSYTCYFVEYTICIILRFVFVKRVIGKKNLSKDISRTSRVFDVQRLSLYREAHYRSTSKLVSLGFLTLSTHGAVIFHQVVTVFLVRRTVENGLSPEIRSQIRVGLGDSSVSCLGC